MSAQHVPLNLKYVSEIFVKSKREYHSWRERRKGRGRDREIEINIVRER